MPTYLDLACRKLQSLSDERQIILHAWKINEEMDRDISLCGRMIHDVVKSIAEWEYITNILEHKIG